MRAAETQPLMEGSQGIRTPWCPWVSWCFLGILGGMLRWGLSVTCWGTWDCLASPGSALTHTWVRWAWEGQAEVTLGSQKERTWGQGFERAQVEVPMHPGALAQAFCLGSNGPDTPSPTGIRASALPQAVDLRLPSGPWPLTASPA